MSGRENQFDATLLTKEITTEKAEARALEFQTAHATLEKQLEDVAAATRRIAAEEARINVDAQAVRNRQQELTLV